MQRKKSKGIEWLEFDLLADIKKLKHGVFLRYGGSSVGPYESLNLSDRVGDNPSHVESNLNEVSGILKCSRLKWSRQCHGIGLNEVSNVECSSEIPEGDALASDVPGVGLMIHHADCQAAIFYDPIHHSIANVHSGWRGSVQNIYATCIAFMQKRYKSNPNDILVCISPSLGPENAQFVNYRKELPESFWDFQIKPDYFDFWAISKHQLTQCGVLPGHIEVASICTYGNPHDYFSYRRFQTTGRNATAVVLN